MAQLDDGNLKIYKMKKIIQEMFTVALFFIISLVVICMIELAFGRREQYGYVIIVTMCYIVSYYISRCIFKFLNEVTVERSEIEP